MSLWDNEINNIFENPNISTAVRFLTSWSSFVKFCHLYFFAVLNSLIFYLYNDTNIMLISHF